MIYYGAEEIKLGKWKNKKTGIIYIITGGRINSTNDQNGQQMIEYEPEDISPEEFGCVREINEFLEKFEKVD